MKELNLTQGSVPKVLLQFAVPFLVANILQALYGGADLFVVGQYDDSAGVAAVAIGSQVMQTITGIILGITTGTTVLIAIATGAKDNRKVASTIGSSIWLFSITGIILTLLMILLHSQIAEWMHTPTEAMSDTKSYILVCSTGILFIIGYNVVCGILRGLGDSKTPLYFIALACIINIVLDFILVGYFHLGATGAAIATVTAQGVSFATALCFLHRKGFHFEFTRRDIRLNGVLSKRILALGAPIALQDALINVSFLIITVIVNQMGVIASASFGCCRENYCFCHVAPNGHILCRSHNDGTKLWCRTHTENEPMPSFRHRARSHFRSYGLPVLAILAGNTYGLFLQRPCGNIDGSRIFERIQHRLCHRQLCVLYQFLFQRARQLTVSNDTQFDSDFPVSYSAFILVQPNRQFLTVYHGICTPALNNRITPDMYMVFEIHKR